MPSTTVNRPIPAKISPGLSAFFMAAGSAQVPCLACRAAAFGGGQGRGAVLVGHYRPRPAPRRGSAACFAPMCRSRSRTRRRAGGHSGRACRRRRAASRRGRRRSPTMPALPRAVSVPCARYRRGGLRGRLRGESCGVDHGGDAAFALRFKRASGGERLPAGRQHQECRRRCPLAPCRISHDAALFRLCCGMLDVPGNTTRDCQAGGGHGSQRHRTYFSDRLEFPNARANSTETAAVSRAEAGHRHRHDLLLRRRTHRGRDQRAVAGACRAAFEQSASACIISAFAPASAPTSTNCTASLLARCEDHSRAARGSMGAGILFAAVRRSRRDQAGLNHVPGKGLLV